MSLRHSFALFLAAIALPSLSLAQVVAVSNMSETSFSREACESDELLAVSFTYVGSAGLTSPYEIFAAAALLGQELTVCSSQPSSSDNLIDGQSLPLDASVVLPDDHEFTVSEFLANVCDDNGFRGDRYLCMRVTSSYSNYGEGGGIAFAVDTQVPGQPSGLRWSGGEASVVLAGVDAVEGLADGEIVDYVIELRACDGDADDAGVDDDAALVVDAAVVLDSAVADASPEDGAIEDGAFLDAAEPDSAVEQDAAQSPDAAEADAAEADAAEDDAGESEASLCDSPGAYVRGASGPELPLRVSGLINGRRYEVRLYVEDEAGNKGEASESAIITPAPEFGFWDIYAGEEEGFGETSCAQSSAGSWGLAALALVLVALLWRRRRTSSLLVFALALGAAPFAQADVFDVGVHVSGGPYKPGIDSEAGANNVYQCVFEDKTWLMSTGGVDLILFDFFGTLSIGGELGYFTIGGFFSRRSFSWSFFTYDSRGS